ncbi:Uncharacterised protein [Enterobacter hormaechei]|nr:hypothetical protein CSC02_3133 [Enterobacter hormaechei subsp. hoffmannii]EUM41284.1 hypothetical protein L406_02556 [Enterobacter sp. BWH 37]EUM72733.1 hypothetical protein L353_09089 [Enterobacter sp. MGH 7]KDF38442.1 hypothetical protein AE41_03009 [Enterobacter hormaechei]KDF47403.1 hypothetical protein AE07_02563 [Enterobacter cloacae BWH 43]KLW22889.1 hypothetical protein SK49_02876 [Enterobacter sp. BWH63]CAE7050032.1 hypothetical protein AI2697V1_0589 [Enterobacter cloacae]
MIDLSGCYDKAHYGFMSNKSGSTVNVLALAITLFRII